MPTESYLKCLLKVSRKSTGNLFSWICRHPVAEVWHATGKFGGKFKDNAVTGPNSYGATRVRSWQTMSDVLFCLFVYLFR